MENNHVNYFANSHLAGWRDILHNENKGKRSSQTQHLIRRTYYSKFQLD